MPERILSHLRSNLVAYVALFVALGGSSYAAVRLTPGSVGTRALANGAVTHNKLAAKSVGSRNVANGSLTSADLKPGMLDRSGAGSPAKGDKGDPGGAFVGGRARFAGTASAPHGATTNLPLTGNSWTQDAGELDLLAGSVTVTTPAACSGSFGHALIVSVDGTPTTFGVPPQIPPSSPVTVPLLVGTLTEPGAGTQHQVTAELKNACTKDGEDFVVKDLKLDVLKFK